MLGFRVGKGLWGKCDMLEKKGALTLSLTAQSIKTNSHKDFISVKITFMFVLCTLKSWNYFLKALTSVCFI